MKNKITWNTEGILEISSIHPFGSFAWGLLHF